MSNLPKNLPSSSKPPKNPNPTTAETDSAFPPTTDDALDHASHLTRPELLKRRLRLFKRLDRCYRDFYWAFMEDLRMKYREYYWIFGASPFKQDHNQDPEREIGERENLEGSGENGHAMMNGNGVISLDLKNNQRCSFVGCKFKAMALTSFCHLHILSDSKQKLYKPCTYVIKSAQAGPIVCGKPILRSVVPSLCTSHFQKAQKHVNRALKKAGLNVSSSSRLAPKFHVVVAEYVRHIQAERRAEKRGIKDSIRIKEENGS